MARNPTAGTVRHQIKAKVSGHARKLDTPVKVYEGWKVPGIGNRFEFWQIHPDTDCVGQGCTFHNPSESHMSRWPMILRETGLVERQCPHGIGHPDPDSMAYFNRRDGTDSWGVHGCDGCCMEEE